MTRSKPPPGKKRIGDWVGMVVLLKRDVRSSRIMLPAGTVVRVCGTTPGGVNIEVPGRSRAEAYVRQVPTDALEPIGHTQGGGT